MHEPFPQRNYTPLILAGVPRSGSNLLRSLLNNHPDMIVHGEVFNNDEQARITALLWKDRPRVAYESGTFTSHLETHVFPLDAGNLKVVGCKIFPFHIGRAPEGKEEFTKMIRLIPGLKVILIERRNIVDMAISGLIARRDRIWMHYCNGEAAQPVPLAALPMELIWQMECIHKEQEEIRHIVEGCDVYRVSYDDLIHRTDDIVRDLQRWLGVDVRTLRPRSLMRKQRTLPRREVVEHFDAFKERCALKHPEWLPFFDEPEDLAELQLGSNTRTYAVAARPVSPDTTDVHTTAVPAFYLQVFHDADIAEHALRQLRKSYPRSRVMLQSDGDDDPAYDRLAQLYRCTYFRGERLYPVEHRGAMIQRMLNDFLSGPGDWLVKMDTDTRIDRPFRYFPSENAVAGCLLHQGPAQGGCVMMSRRVAEKIRDSRLLLDPVLRHPEESWGKHMTPSFLHERLATTGCIGFEWTLYWACTQLEIPTVQHPEIYATWKDGHSNNDRRFAAVHPDKFLDIDDRSIHDLCTASHVRANALWLEAIYRS